MEGNNKGTIQMDNNTEDVIETPINLALMPESVAKAVIKVMSGVTKLKKLNDNKFDGYRFASIDDFMEMINPIQSEAGLIIIQMESHEPKLVEKSGKKGNVLMLWCRHHYYLFSADGKGYGPIARSIMVQATGAQAFGSAQSYSLKQFQRALFQIPTGEKDDPDNAATKDMGSPPTIDPQAIATRVNRAVSTAKTEKALEEVSKKYSDDLLLVKTASQTAYEFLMDAITKKQQEFKEM